MLKKKYILKDRKEIQRVFNKGDIVFSPYFNIKYNLNNLTYSRFCIIISKKISRSAIDRNKIKRQIRSIIFKNFTNIGKNYDFIILTKPPAINHPYKDLAKTFIFLLSKVK